MITGAMYRATNQDASLEILFDEAVRAHQRVLAIKEQLLLQNAALLKRGQPPHALQEYSMPSHGTAPKSEAELRGLKAFFESEATRLEALIDQGTTTAPRELTLGAAPRAVPWQYVVAEFGNAYWRYLRYFAFPPVGAGLGIGLFFAARAAAPVQWLPVLLVHIIALVTFAKRLSFLRVGTVPTSIAEKTGYRNVHIKNWPTLYAAGWQIELRSYTGTGHFTEISYLEASGEVRTSKVKSGPKFGGRILAVAGRGVLPNIAFACAPKPNTDGNWAPDAVPTHAWITGTLGLMLLAALTTYAALLPM
ncbi:MAG TPA: hypothetical protein PLF40_24455 [Kofleriaceae bacterium]|nr:hypothetical protein [Kofleriaceae bacterium]